MEQVTPEGASAPVESETPAVSPDGVAPEAVKPAAEPPAAEPESDELRGVAKRIKELTDARKAEAEARRAAEAREARLMSLVEQQQAARPQQQKLKTPADFNHDNNAWLDYAVETRLQQKEMERAEEQRKQEERRLQVTFKKREAEFAKNVEDYSEVAHFAPISDAIAGVVMRLDEGPAIAYYLGKNPEIAEQISELPIEVASAELGRIATRLELERKKAAERAVSKAPPPPPKVEGAGDGSTKAKPDDPASDKELSDAEWTRRRNAQLAARRKRS